MIMDFCDFEVLPNWWLFVAGYLPENLEDLNESVKETFIVIHSDMPNARDLLMQRLRTKNEVKVGYNIKHYDLIIANAIYNGLTPREVKIVSDIIINPSLAYSSKEHLRLQTFAKKKIGGVCYQDLMDDNTGTLKEKEAILGLDIEESNVSFDKEDLTDADKEELIYYCKHDVYASMYFYKKVLKDYINNKLVIGKKFNIPENECYMCTNANLVSKALGARRTIFTDSDRLDIDLPNSIRQYCYDNLPSKILDRIRTDPRGFEVKLFDNTVSFGNGGIHSVYSNNLYVESDDEYVLLIVDGTSYYPSMLIQFECLSRAVKDPNVFSDIFNERIALKHKKQMTEEDNKTQLANKLVLNTTYGASGNKYLDLYDPYMCTRCCRIGQIFLAALACKIVKTITTAKIIQSNTDGLFIYCRKNDLPKLKKLQDEWTAVSGINMDTEFVEKIWQRDVNNYLLVKEGGKIKRKGLWLMDTWEKPGTAGVGPLSAFVSQKAVINYLVNGQDILTSIVNNHNIADFVMTCKKGPSYRGVIQRLSNGTEKELFKCNRVYASKDASLGQIYKYKMYKGDISYSKIPNIPDHCRLINNDLSSYKFDDIRKDIDYMFYVQRCMDLLDIDWIELRHSQLVATNRFNYFD